MINQEAETMFRLGLDALWNCNNPFTKEELTIELGKVGLEVKDFDVFIELYKDVIFKEGNKYRLNITNAVNEFHNKKD